MVRGIFFIGKIRRICIDRCSDAWFYSGFIHWASEPSKHLCRRYMRSTECPSSFSVSLSVCLLARLIKNARAWIWMKCCVSTDVGTWTNLLTFEPDPDNSPDAGTGLLSPISYRLRNSAALHRLPASCAATRNFTSGKSQVYVLAARRYSEPWF